MPKVLIVDESPEFQEMLTIALKTCDISVVAKLSTSQEINSTIQRYKPQVLILDLFLKPHDALFVIDHLMREFPIPIILFLPPNYPENSEIIKEASRIGAALVCSKPMTKLALNWALPELSEEIFRLANISRVGIADQYLKKRSVNVSLKTALPAQKALGIVGSTGAVEILKAILLNLPPKFTPATLVAQHMSVPVWENFKNFLSQSANRPVAMAGGGEIIREGHILLSPIQRTLMLQRSYAGKIAILENANKFTPGQVPLQPNLDQFLISLAENFRSNAIGVILSGMGTDGTEGAKAILAKGGRVLIQDPSTAILPSMPVNAAKKNPRAQLCRPENLLAEIVRLSG